EGDANVLDGVVVIDVQVALAFDIQVDQPVASDLVEHVLEERHADGESRLAGAIQIDSGLDLGFQGVALYASRTFGHPTAPLIRGAKRGTGEAKHRCPGMAPAAGLHLAGICAFTCKGPAPCTDGKCPPHYASCWRPGAANCSAWRI